MHPCFSWSVFRAALNVRFRKSKKTLKKERFPCVNYVLLCFKKISNVESCVSLVPPGILLGLSSLQNLTD